MQAEGQPTLSSISDRSGNSGGKEASTNDEEEGEGEPKIGETHDIEGMRQR